MSEEQAPENQEVSQETLEMLSTVANDMAKSDKRIVDIVNAMILARQINAVVIQNLDQLFETEEFQQVQCGEETVTLTAEHKAMLKEIFVNAAAMQAQRPFDGRQMFNFTVSSLLPWLRDHISKQYEEEKRKQKERFEANEKARVETPIRVGLPGLAECSRERPVLLVGEANALRAVMDQVTADASSADSGCKQSIRLMYSWKAFNPGCLVVPHKMWVDAAKTTKSFQKIYESWIASNLQEPIDLLLVDDLRAASGAPDFFSAESVANDAQHRLAKWSKKAGCLLISAMPLKAGEDFLSSDKLREHNHLLHVAAVEDGDVYHVTVNGTEFVTVDKAEFRKPLVVADTSVEVR